MASYLSGYTRRKKLTIRSTQIDEALTGFPVLVAFNDDAQIGASARSDGYDLRFTSADGTTLLPYERRSFTASGGLASGLFWVRVPTLAADADTVLYLYYGDSAASDVSSPSTTWGATEYRGVWHLDGNVLDSSGNGYHGTNHGTVDGDGKIGRGRTFDDTLPAYVDVGNAGIAGSLTILAWFRTDRQCVAANSDDQTIVGKALWGGDTSGDYILKLTTISSAMKLGFWRYASTRYLSLADTRTISTNTWYRVGVTYDGTTQLGKIYLNGVAGASNTLGGTMAANAHATLLGMQEINGHLPFSGELDEISIAYTARSAAWLKFDYYNQTSSDNEITWGNEQTQTEGVAAETASAGMVFGVQAAFQVDTLATVSASDTLGFGVEATAGLSNTASIGEGWSAQTDARATYREIATVADGFAAQATHRAAVQATTLVGDGWTAQTDAQGAHSETASASDSLVAHITHQASHTAVAVATETLVLQTDTPAFIGASAEGSEAVTGLVATAVGIRDEGLVGDGWTGRGTIHATQSDAATPAETLVGELLGRPEGVLAEAAHAVEVLKARVVARGSVHDVAIAVEPLTTHANRRKAIADRGTVIDEWRVVVLGGVGAYTCTVSVLPFHTLRCRSRSATAIGCITSALPLAARVSSRPAAGLAMAVLPTLSATMEVTAP